MKNRLEAAREFLSDDGVIFVQCDDNEQAYLKVLMDEIFGRDNFINTIIWEKSILHKMMRNGSLIITILFYYTLKIKEFGDLIYYHAQARWTHAIKI